MATIYFRKIKVIGYSYWSAYKVDKLKPSEAAGLSLLLSEYRVVCGDISESPVKKLAEMRREMKKDGHKIVLEKPSKRKR